jgi:DNA ligase-1
MALTDAFRVAEVLTEEGAEGLRKIQLQPLVPVKPMLAGGTVDEIKADEFPVWVERKYDGIRLMLHKSTDARGSMLCGAYTRNRGDWLEQIAGLEATIKAIPVNTMIIDGELFGTVLDLDGARPATVYEVYATLQGEPTKPVNLKFAAFDAIYFNGQDLTRQTLSQRRQVLQMLLGPMEQVATPIPLSVAEGHMANTKDDLNRLFHHFRAQGYEGIITKTLDAPYMLNTRAPDWKKRKPEITLDLVLVGATFAVTTKENAGVFGSYVIAARTDENDYEIVGDVAGVDKVRDQEIQIEIMRDGLMTGERIERASASGVRPGIELRPSIVVTVKFEGITRDNVTGALSLRDPKLVVIRSDKSANEADKVSAIEELYLRERVG